MQIQVPELDHDRMMKERFGHEVGARGRLERRIVAGLCAHLEAAGFAPHSVYDGEEETRVSNAKEAMELVFNLDEASLRFAKPGHREHGVLLVLGNGEDLVSDWNYSKGDCDGFDAAMEAFLDSIETLF